MSMSSIVNEAIRIAKRNLGDIVVSTQIKNKTGSVYQNGKYVTTYATVDIDYVPGKWSFEEQVSGNFGSSDLKIDVFNLDDALEIGSESMVSIDGLWYNVFKVIPNKVGALNPVISLVLRR